jgi:WD40 repeat protein
LNNKIVCGTFAKKLSTNFAIGDEQNNLLIYNNLDNKPLAILNPQTSNTSSLTSLAFNKSDTQIISGSSRGSINVWDLATSKSTDIK